MVISTDFCDMELYFTGCASNWGLSDPIISKYFKVKRLAKCYLIFWGRKSTALPARRSKGTKIP